LARDESGGCPAYWPGGVRHRGDVSLICGFCVEREKAHPEIVALVVRVREGVSWAAETVRD